MTMSCPEVVYQAYYPYLYQRPSTAHSAHSSPVSRAAPFPPFSHQYDRFNVQRPLEQPSSSLGESPAASAASAGGASHASSAAGSAYLGLSHHHPPSSVGSVSSGGGGVGSPGSPPLSAPSLPRHKEEDSGGPRSAEAGVADDEDAEPLHSVDLDSSRESTGEHGHAQYLSANCVVFTHYSGDAAAVVDEHFSRALAYADSKAATQGKESSPMTARNFPASFWNSNYQSPSGLSGVGGLAASGLGAAGVAGMGMAGVSHHGDLYADAHPYHHSATTPTDPWHSHYPQYSAAAHHHRAVHDYHHHHNMAAQYGGLLLPPARLPAHAHQYSKEWAPGGHHPHHAHHGQSMAHHHGLDAGPAGYSYPGMAGLEAQVQETSKDLYWI